ncbi:NAD(P)H-binding protein [Saccharopolyspora sp. NPDC050389]|uniref:NAD(P)H-binding protein n=1 Tax=Saccharopolyspora sp. NPDC050389 TaxID=3155516 RepID=UPI0033D307C0
MAKVLVTGATGNVGRQVVHQLLRSTGAAVRAVARNVTGLSADVEPVSADLADPGAFAAALGGIDAVFLIWPLHTAEALPAVLDAVGDRRLVFLGTGGVRDLDMVRQQQMLGANSVFIRPSTFAANALWWAPQIRAGDVVRGAFGELAVSMLHERDIAAVAVRALLDDSPDAAYALTGPEVLSQAEQVRIIGAALGRPIRWQEVSRTEARQQMLADGFPRSFVDVLLATYAAMLTQPPPLVTGTVEAATGVPARTFRQWADDHADDFR